MMKSLLDVAERMNLAYPNTLFGQYFHEMVAILAIVFGGAFLLYAYQHQAYFGGVVGFLLGGWLGLLVRTCYLSEGTVPPLLYVALFAVGGACLAVFFPRLVGILLGGFTSLLGVFLVSPEILETHPNQNLLFPLLFVLGGGIGALFPRFFFILDSSLIGAAFVTYGVSAAILPKLMPMLPATSNALLHLGVFLPAVCFGVLYQFFRQPSGGGGPAHQEIVIKNRA